VEEGIPIRLSGFRLPVEHLSATSLADFVQCPEKWRRERLKNEWGKKSLDAFIGSVHHNAMGLMLHHRMNGMPYADGPERVMGYAWQDQMDSDDGEPEWTDTPDNVFKLNTKMMISALPVIKEIEPLGVEQFFEFTVKGVPVPIRGSIDAHTKVVNWEFKTNKQKVSTPKSKWQFQARIYQLANPKPTFWAVTTKQVQPVSYWPMHADTPNLTMPVENPDVTVLMIRQAVEQMNDLYARYGPDEHWPLTGVMHEWLCSYCTFGPRNPNPTCPAWRESERAAELRPGRIEPSSERGDGERLTSRTGSHVEE